MMKNKYNLTGDIGIGYTYNTNQEFYFDLEDYDKIKEYCWSVWHRKETNYSMLCAKKTLKPKVYRNVYMARIILNITDKDIIVDHIDRNPLNNCKNNLRICNSSTNSKNTSKPKNSNCEFMGVSFEKGKYCARIGYNRKKIHLGRFSNIEDAIITRLKAEKQYYGEFAPQRDLFEKYNI